MKFFTAITLVTFATPALALDISQPLMSDEGKPYCTQELKTEDAVCPTDKVYTLGRALRVALHSTYGDEQNLSGDDKAKRGEIAQGLVGATEVKLKVEDLALVKKLTGKAFPPGMVYAIWKMLEK